MYGKKSFLRQSGYLLSSQQRLPLKADGSPIPWMNYHIIQFLESRFHKQLTLYEFGSGNSTRFYADRVGEVNSVENNPQWYQLVSNTLPENVHLTLAEDHQDYINSIRLIGKSSDIVIVDGLMRVECAKVALECLSEGGVMVLDDSDRQDYAEIFQLMANAGFRKIDFRGLKPGSISAFQTTVFYKDNNCLGI